MDVRGKTVAITGAGRGIGRALSQQFASLGAQLALIDQNAEDLDRTVALCAPLAVHARGYSVNVAREAEVIELMDRVVADFGRLDGLVNNAGIVRDGLLVKAKDGVVSDKLSLADWQAVIDVNLTAVFLCGREAAQRMIEHGEGGVIVNISSISRAGNFGQTNYSAAKAGVFAMTVVWAKELARFGIRVGAIAPGFIRTPMVESMRPEALAKVMAPIPLARLGQPEEIARAVAFVFESDYLTGRCLELDGGLRL